MSRRRIRRHRDAAKEVEIENRRKIVAVNLLAGATYREIASAVEVDPAIIVRDRRAVLKEWRQHYSDSYERLVALQSRRYDILLNALWEKATQGDLNALDRVLKILDRIDRIIGVSGRIDVTTSGQPVTFEVRAVDYRSAIGPLAPSAN